MFAQNINLYQGNMKQVGPDKSGLANSASINEWGYQTQRKGNFHFEETGTPKLFRDMSWI